MKHLVFPQKIAFIGQTVVSADDGCKYETSPVRVICCGKTKCFKRFVN